MVSKNQKPKSISLFSGAGGMDLGVEQAGFEELASIELDKNCCETLRHWPSKRETLVIESDIRKINPAELMKSLHLKKGELDLLHGGPPCQSFSLIGKRGSINDERGLLLFEMARFAKEFRPKVVLIEQVRGLLSAKDQEGKVGSVFQKLIERFHELGYQTKYAILNAANYGVPQTRQRVFIVAWNGRGDFSFPPPTHESFSEQGALLPRLAPYVTVGTVLANLPKPLHKGRRESFPNHVDVTPAGDRLRISGVPEGCYLANQFHLPVTQRGKLHPQKDTTKFKRLHRKSPSLTLRCGEIFFHPTQNRYLSPREYLRIHGYSDRFILQGPIRGRSGTVKELDQHRQVANSVPPPLARAVATAILAQLFK